VKSGDSTDVHGPVEGAAPGTNVAMGITVVGVLALGYVMFDGSDDEFDNAWGLPLAVIGGLARRLRHRQGRRDLDLRPVRPGQEDRRRSPRPARPPPSSAASPPA
jgi:hypothetical protein